MEYQIIKPGDPNYPKKLLQRAENPPPLYYNGPLRLLDRWTLSVISADSISGLAMMAANQLLFTLREYHLNYIGGWHSVMETEIFRLGLFRKNVTVTLFSAKGLAHETLESYLEDRFYPPLHQFPERDEYFRRAKEKELLILSAADPDENKTIRKNVMNRNWLSCLLADAVFIPYAAKGTKTYTLAKEVVGTGIPVFTTEDDTNYDLHQLKIPALNRKTVGLFLDERNAPQNGEPLSIPPSVFLEINRPPSSNRQPSEQMGLWQKRKRPPAS
jgi:hypothetical protein